MAKFRKRPIVIEAEQFFFDKLPWPEGVEQQTVMTSNSLGGPQAEVLAKSCQIPTFEGVMHVSDGDWILKGINGEYYPCKPDIFQKTHEALKE